MIGADGEQVGVLTRDEALSMAEEAGLDLVEIVPNADPPVCRVMDFGKFKFEQQKKAHAAKRKTKQVEIKELKFRPSTEDGDYNVKMRNMKRFLEEGEIIPFQVEELFRLRRPAERPQARPLPSSQDHCVDRHIARSIF